MRNVQDSGVILIHVAKTPIVSARVSDLGFGQFELKKWLAETETSAKTETLAETSKTGRNWPKLSKTVQNCSKL